MTASTRTSTPLRVISRSGRQVIAEMEERERARTGIAFAQGALQPRLRLLHRDLEVEPGRRARTTISASRRSPAASASPRSALKEYEEKVLGADERILEREMQIFESLRQQIAAHAPRIQDTARALASLDVLAGLAETAAVANYTKPHVHDGDDFVVGRRTSSGGRALLA